MKLKVIVLALVLALVPTTTVLAERSAAFGKTVVNSNITEADVQAAQEAWGKALVQISKDFDSGGVEKATATANAVLDAAYGYNMGAVLFKPTLTYGEQTFRTRKEGALAYFVGGNKEFPNDTGFALKGWTKYEYKNAAVYINGDMAITMGNVYLTAKDGKVTMVDKTWGFKKDEEGKLRIVLHHSSLPFSPEAKK
jgi:hypothetical protein